MPDISVVIPLYKAAGYLPELLARLEAQTFPPDRFEVILVDDLSPDQTRQVAAALLARSSLTIKLIERTENGGVSAARNTGWLVARSPLILFIDQDCLADAALLESHYQAHRAGAGRVAVAGRIVWSDQFQENPASEYYKATYFPAWPTFRPGGPNFQLFITSNASVSRAGLVEVGGFDEAFRHNYDDVSCGYRLEKAGFRIELCPVAVVYHHRPLPVAEMFRRTNVAGREMVRFFQHFPELIGHWWLLNPAQALDWAYRLSSIAGLLAATLDKSDLADLTDLAPLLNEAGQYLLQKPFLEQVDRPFLTAWFARHTYQQSLSQVGWLEAARELRTGPDYRPPPGLLTRLKPMARRVYPQPPVPRPTTHEFKLTVIVVPPDPTATGYLPDLLRGLAVQTLDPKSFEVTAALKPAQAANFKAADWPFQLRLITCPQPETAWAVVAGLARSPWLVLLASDCRPAPDLLQNYLTRLQTDRVLIGLELPLPNSGPAHFEVLPDGVESLQTGLVEPPLHFSALSFASCALSTGLFKTSFDPRIGPVLAPLVMGWRLALAGKVGLQSCPTAVTYASQTRRLGQRLLRAALLPHEMTGLQRYYPTLAELYTYRLKKGPPPAEANWHLLYDTLKEYPFSLGLAEGLAGIFDIKNRVALQQHPYFEKLSLDWEQNRQNLFQAEFDAIEANRPELESYRTRLAQSLA